MSKQTINIGASPNDGTGTPLRTSFDYTNQNFTELYTALGGGVGLPGATTQVIFNDGGTNLAGDAGLVYNKTTDALTVGGNVQAASATITGDLTVDTSTLKVDATNDRVGIGTASPAAAAKLSVLGTTVVSTSDYSNSSTWASRFQAAANSQPSGILLSALASNGSAVPASLHVEPVTTSSRGALVATYVADSGLGYFAINRFSPSAGTTSQHYKIDDTGVATWSNVGGVAGTAMTLNSTGLGVGTSSIVNAAAGRGNVTIGGSSSAILNLSIGAVDTGYVIHDGTSIYLVNRIAAGSLIFSTNSTERLRIDSSGNVGIGVTPSASWVTYKALEFDTGIVSGSSSMALNRNCYFDGVNWRYKVTTSFGIAQYQLSGNGNHIWNIASSGNAGAAINGGTGAWTEAMTLDASGNLMVGVASSSNRLDIQKSTDCAVLVKSTGANTNIAMDYVSNYGNHTIRKSGTAVWDFGVINDSSATPAFKFSNGPSAVGVQLVHGATAWTALSDETVKDIIEPITNAITKVGSLRSVIGKFKTDDASKRRSFLIAQDVFAVLPEAVDVVGEKNELGVRYSDVIPLLVAAIKELSAEVNALKNA